MQFKDRREGSSRQQHSCRHLKVVGAIEADIAQSLRHCTRSSIAGLFFGGFRTTAPTPAASTCAGRHPKPFTIADISRQHHHHNGLALGPTGKGRQVREVRLRTSRFFESSQNARASGRPPIAVQRSCDLLRDPPTVIKQPSSILRVHSHLCCNTLLVDLYEFEDRTACRNFRG